MAIILAYIETESIPSHKFTPLPVPSTTTPQKTYTNPTLIIDDLMYAILFCITSYCPS